MNRRHTLLAAGGLLIASLISGFAPECHAVTEKKVLTKPQMEKFSKVADIVLDKCMACHSRDYDLPFYAKIPGIKSIIEKDFNDGLRAMDLNAELVGAAKDKPVSEATLAKMEWVIKNETMPPAKFTAVHWGSRVTDADEKVILDWVKETRATHYATGLASPARANEPLQQIGRAHV